MDESTRGAVENELVDDETAADLLRVTADRIDVMVEEGMLTPVGRSPRTFRRAEVIALGESGA